jgi:hypothetical protein
LRATGDLKCKQRAVLRHGAGHQRTLYGPFKFYSIWPQDNAWFEAAATSEDGHDTKAGDLRKHLDTNTQGVDEC